MLVVVSVFDASKERFRSFETGCFFLVLLSEVYKFRNLIASSERVCIVSIVGRKLGKETR